MVVLLVPAQELATAMAFPEGEKYRAVTGRVANKIDVDQIGDIVFCKHVSTC